mmetsp:Transcript_1737/g.2507  ORF Transcript_1737/g.2507 Transcript_1737/m.2507 type:complete len:275 (-) Transcript_1737:72-896(-)
MTMKFYERRLSSCSQRTRFLILFILAFWTQHCGGMIPPHTTHFVGKSKDTKNVPVINHSPQLHTHSVTTKQTTDVQGDISEKEPIDRGISKALSKSTKFESKPSEQRFLEHCELEDCWNFGINCKDELYICSSSLIQKMHDVYGPHWMTFVASTAVVTFVATFLIIKIAKFCMSYRGKKAKTGYKHDKMVSETKKNNLKDLHDVTREANQKGPQNPKKNLVGENAKEDIDPSKAGNSQFAKEYVDRAFTTKSERRRSSLMTGPIQIEKRVRLVW